MNNAVECDMCDKEHDTLTDHCLVGVHCIVYDVVCNTDWHNFDHPELCCVCNKLVIKPRQA